MEKSNIINISAILAAAILLILGGWWLFTNSTENTVTFNPEETLKIRRVEKARQTSRENIDNFLKSNLIDELYDNEQYRDLRDVSVQINLDNIGNEKPFTSPEPETSSELEQ